jgi:putative NIF3 family GTP cyclohydrolase 1 type 2
MHTNLDNARGGVNWKMAEKLGLGESRFFARKAVNGIEAGSGVIGRLAEEMAADDFVLKVKRTFGVECAMCNELLRRPIRQVAVAGGAADFLLDDAIAEGADAFITGEMHYHQYFGYEQRVQICVIGHYQSEQFTAEILRDIIRRECPSVRTEMAETCTNPILYL